MECVFHGMCGRWGVDSCDVCVCVCVRKCVRWGQLCSRFGALCPKRKHWPVLFLVSAVHSESSAVGNRSHSVSSPVG